MWRSAACAQSERPASAKARRMSAHAGCEMLRMSVCTSSSASSTLPALQNCHTDATRSSVPTTDPVMLRASSRPSAIAPSSSISIFRSASPLLTLPPRDAVRPSPPRDAVRPSAPPAAPQPPCSCSSSPPDRSAASCGSDSTPSPDSLSLLVNAPALSPRLEWRTSVRNSSCSLEGTRSGEAPSRARFCVDIERMGEERDSSTSCPPPPGERETMLRLAASRPLWEFFSMAKPSHAIKPPPSATRPFMPVPS
mmetsp:Transcript_40391/g.95613  ORF Transcript_40391/g.95613 Transcript_40391/m.95613 type:complete len:252 (-) Transcript_40391:409-1164(-)